MATSALPSAAQGRGKIQVEQSVQFALLASDLCVQQSGKNCCAGRQMRRARHACARASAFLCISDESFCSHQQRLFLHIRCLLLQRCALCYDVCVAPFWHSNFATVVHENSGVHESFVTSKIVAPCAWLKAANSTKSRPIAALSFVILKTHCIVWMGIRSVPFCLFDHVLARCSDGPHDMEKHSRCDPTAAD